MRNQQTDLHSAPVVRQWLIDALCAAQPGRLLFIGSTHPPITQEGGCKFSGAAEQSSARTATWTCWQVPLASSTSRQGSCGLKGPAQDREPGDPASSAAPGEKGPLKVTWSNVFRLAFPLLIGNSLSTIPSVVGDLLHFGGKLFLLSSWDPLS